MQQLNTNGEYVDFPDDQQYEVGMAEGCVWGDILAKPAGGEFTKNNYFASVVKPIMFVAADSLEDDGGTVKLDIGIVETLNEKVKHKTVDTSWQRIKAELDKFYAAKRGKTHTFAKIEQDTVCKILNISSEVVVHATIQTLSNIEIVYPNANSNNEIITNEPNMPLVTCQARLKQPVSGQIKMEWSYVVDNEIKRNDLIDHPITDLCPRISRFIFKGITYTNNSMNINSWSVPFKKANLNYVNVMAPLPVRYCWGDDGDTIKSSYPGDCGKGVSSWDGDDWNSKGDIVHMRDRLITGENIFVGGNVSVSVIARDENNNIVGYGFAKANKIVGDNPLPAQIIAFTDDPPVKAIMRTESSRKQFLSLQLKTKESAGMPKYGLPNGFGLMQIDNSPTPHEADLWNWRQNMSDGINRFYTAWEAAIKETKKHKLNVVKQKVLLMNAWQNYNSSHFYYDYIEGQWVISQYILDLKAKGKPIYAEMVLKNYIP
jgi:hypothetical protein